MDKVYLVIIAKGDHDDYCWWVDGIYSSPEKAEGRKLAIFKKVDLAKMDYFSTFGATPEKDEAYINSAMDDLNLDAVEYDKVVLRFYSFTHDNPELEYDSIIVTEKEVL